MRSMPFDLKLKPHGSPFSIKTAIKFINLGKWETIIASSYTNTSKVSTIIIESHSIAISLQSVGKIIQSEIYNRKEIGYNLWTQMNFNPLASSSSSNHKKMRLIYFKKQYENSYRERTVMNKLYSLSTDANLIQKSSSFNSPSAKSVACQTQDLSLPACSWTDIVGRTATADSRSHTKTKGNSNQKIKNYNILSHLDDSHRSWESSIVA